MAHTVDRDLTFFHRLEQRRLHAGCCAVELVGEKEVAENDARLVAHHAGFLVENAVARDIARKNVRRKLHAPIVQPQRPGKRERHRRLADARYILEQNMTPRENDRKYPDQHAVLAADRLFDLRENLTCLIHCSASSVLLSYVNVYRKYYTRKVAE